MKDPNYTHYKRLLTLNALSLIFVLFLMWFNHLSRGDDGGYGLIVIVPIFWIVWAWSALADLLQILNWAGRKIGAYPKKG